MDECALCGETKDLRDSHIIPRFVIKWMKKTGATPFLRKAADPNSRFQDYHEELLCDDCEQIFSDFEREFAGNVFYPHVRGEKDEFEYGDWLYKFVLSISWRLLVSDLAAWQDYNQIKKESIIDIEELWRNILLGKTSISSDPSTHHILFLDELDLSKSDPKAPDNFEIYMQRAVDGTSVSSTSEVHVYFKFPKILFFSCILPPTSENLKNTEIREEGTIRQPQEIGPKWGDFLFDRIDKYSDPSMSESEHEKVRERIKKNPEKFLESETLNAHIAEMRRKWAEHDLVEYLDMDTCPVCYTNHRVIESIPKLPLTPSCVESIDDKVPYAKATFPREGEVKESIPTNVTDTLIVSTEESTMILQFFMDYGWIVGEEINHHDGVEPEEVGKVAWEQYSEEFHEWMQEKHGK